MSFAVAGTAIATIGSSIISSNAQSDAIDAANASSDKNIAYQERTFKQIKDLLAPFVQGGTSALGKQLDFLGLNGSQPQADIINTVQNSPYFKTVAQQGENAILQNASATGGLRGGNTQVALGQFRPALLNQLLEQYYSKLGGLSSAGQNAAAFTGNAANSSAGTVSNILTNQGDNNASAILAQGKTNAGLFNLIPSVLGSFNGSGGSLFGGGSTPPSYDGIAAAGGIRLPGGF